MQFFFPQMVDLEDGRRSQRASFGFSRALVTASGLEVAGTVLLGSAQGWQAVGSLCVARASRSTTLRVSPSPDPPKLS